MALSGISFNNTLLEDAFFGFNGENPELDPLMSDDAWLGSEDLWNPSVLACSVPTKPDTQPQLLQDAIPIDTPFGLCDLANNLADINMDDISGPFVELTDVFPMIEVPLRASDILSVKDEPEKFSAASPCTSEASTTSDLAAKSTPRSRKSKSKSTSATATKSKAAKKTKEATRKRRYQRSRAKPVLENYADKDAFDKAMEKWKLARESNNLSVKRSREAMREQRRKMDLECSQKQAENAKLESQYASQQTSIQLLKKALEDHKSLTDGEREQLRSILA